MEALATLAGEKCPKEVSPDLNVLEAWALDSLHGMELACDLSARLKINIPLEDNPLVAEDEKTGGRRARTISEVVDYLIALAG